MHHPRPLAHRLIALSAAALLLLAGIFAAGGIPSASAAMMYQMYPWLNYQPLELSAVQPQTAPVIPTIVSTLNVRRFGDRSLYSYRAAATKDIPWYMLAAIDAVELGANNSANSARLSQVKARLIGSTVDQKLRAYGGSSSFIMMVKRRMNDLMRIDTLFNTATHKFPLPLYSGYTYEDSWGAPREFGGERFHEGIDLIVAKGTPVYSASYGTVTKKGWLTLGGWRIGVQDENGIYYYYAHLSQYGSFEIGDTVRPGDILGYVGSTGYGPEGTDNVMIPHLHFGMYENDVAYNPYAFLKAWK
ncbi:hypothetical protein AGMMS49992_08660 [Clostridia bacterium]|nr:hypothetical protein AGMMS49992_08660 [Clostridia bacterium]